MGVLIPLFRTGEPEAELNLSSEEKLRLKLIQNSIEALRKEEKNLELEISEKCSEEIDHLNMIDNKIYQLEQELEDFYRLKKASGGRGSRC